MAHTPIQLFRTFEIVTYARMLTFQVMHSLSYVVVMAKTCHNPEISAFLISNFELSFVFQDPNKPKQYTAEEFRALKKQMQAQGKMIGRVPDD